MGLSDNQWKYMLNLIEKGICTPFIGPEVYYKTIEKVLEVTGIPELGYPLSLAFKESYKEDRESESYKDAWATLSLAFDEFYKLAKDKYGYPLEYSHHLARVAQFLAIEYEDELFPKDFLSSELNKIKPPNFSLEENRNTPYAVLADLNLPIYITTNYDYFMEEALKSRGRAPVSEFCRWNEKLYNYAKEAGIPSVFDKDKIYESAIELKYRPTTEPYRPTKSEPLVYHLHGIIDIPQSMVLTEKDYFEFVIYLNKDDEKRLLPPYVRTALASTSLLFMGYRLEDITFRVIFQGVMSFLGDIRRQYKNMTVQIPTSFPGRAEKVHAYLNAYIKNMFFELHAYWGSLDDFLKELREKLDKFRKEML